MKMIKYVFALVLMFIAFTFSGESYIYYLDNFSADFTSTTMYKPDYVSDEKMKSDLVKSAQENNVEVFTVKEEIKSNINMNITIYGTKEANNYLRKDLSIKERKYNSIFSGTVNVQYYDMKEIPNMSKVTDYFVIGNNENVEAFKVDLIDVYSGNHPRSGAGNNESKQNILIVWGIVCIVLLLFTYYDILFQKKESLVKITLGEKISKLVGKNILSDVLVFTGIFIVAYYCLSPFTHAMFHFRYSLFMFIIFIIINSLLYFSLYLYDVKEAFSNSKSSIRLLTVNYILKTLTLVLVIIVLSGSIALIVEGFNFYSQKDFFETHKDYSYVQFDYKMTGNNKVDEQLLNKGANIREQFYKENFNHAIQLVNISNNLALTAPAILANRNAVTYLRSKIPEIDNIKLQEKVYYMIPSKYAKDKSILQTTKEIYHFYNEGNTKSAPDDEVVVYDTNTDIVSIDELNFINRSKLRRNPIIILDNTNGEEMEITTETSLRKTAYAHDVMYLISKTNYHSFIKKHNLTDQIRIKTNVYDLYKYNWAIIKRGIIISSVLFALVLLLELMIIGLILRLEYEINAIELSIKKILGYTIWEKNKKIIIITLLATISSILIALIINFIFSISQAAYLLFGGLIILIIEVIFIVANITKIENSKIQKILKGGSL